MERCVAEASKAAMTRSVSNRASCRAAAIRAVAALLILMGLRGGPLLAQPFRVQTAPPRSPSVEAQQSFQAKIDEQARLLAGNRHFQSVPEHGRQALVEFVVGNALFVTAHQLGYALLSEMNLPTISGAEQ